MSPLRGGQGRAAGTRTLLVVVVVGLFAAGVGVRSYLDARSYISTDNAQIDGDQIAVNAPASGVLMEWRGTRGVSLRKGAPLGRIEIQGGFGQPRMVIRAPADGVVAVDNGVEGAFVTAGTRLAVAYDGSAVYVTARVDETDIDDVRVGQLVDISVDTASGTDLHGRVIEVTKGAAAVLPDRPADDTSGNFQKVTQVVPVRIAIDDLRNLPLVPGMNVVARIHRD